MGKKNYTASGKNTRNLNLPKYENAQAKEQHTNLTTNLTNINNSLINSNIIPPHMQEKNNYLFNIKR
jgi:hypothetical protein